MFRAITFKSVALITAWAIVAIVVSDVLFDDPWELGFHILVAGLFLLSWALLPETRVEIVERP